MGSWADRRFWWELKILGLAVLCVILLLLLGGLLYCLMACQRCWS